MKKQVNPAVLTLFVWLVLCVLAVLLLPPLQPAPRPTAEPTLAPPIIGTPTISPTVTTSPPIVTATVTVAPSATVLEVTVLPAVTETPQVVATAEGLTPNVRTATPNVPDSGTPAPASKTPTATVIPNIPTTTHTPAVAPDGEMCRRGVITAHAAIDQVLANKPERRCDGCVYYASVLCQDIGKRMELRISTDSTVPGTIIPVTVADCAAWAVGQWPQKAGKDWLGELDINSWPAGAPMAPLEAELCNMNAPQGRP